MRDWEAFVRRHLDLPLMTDRRDQRIVGELAAHAEEAFREARDLGATDEEAEALALATLRDREAAVREILGAERRHAAAEAKRRAESAEDVLREKGALSGRLADLMMELRLTLRALGRRPLFGVAVALTLALGVGASTSIFTLLDTVVLSPLPYRDPHRLVSIAHVPSADRGREIGARPLAQSAAWHFTYEEENRVFQSLAMYSTITVNITGEGEPEAVEGFLVTSSLFPTLGMAPVLGRVLLPSDEDPSSERVAMLGYGYWRSRFGGDSSVVGRTVVVNGVPRQIVGVAPLGIMSLGGDPKVVVPLRLPRAQVFVGNLQFGGVARLRDGVTVADAEADVARMLPLAFEKFPGGPFVDEMRRANWIPIVRPLKAALVGPVGRLLWVIMAGVALVLLIACANVANLMLVRADGRGHEMAVRAAIGASRGRIAWEHLKESLVLCALGYVGAVGLAVGGVRLLAAMPRGRIPRVDEVALDPRALLFATAVSVVAALVFAAAPTIRLRGRDLVGSLKQTGGSVGGGRHRHLTQQALATGQIAIAVVVLAAAGLLFRSAWRLWHVDPGFSHRGDVLAVRLTAAGPQLPQDAAGVARLEEAVARSLGEVAGVRSVGMATQLPMGPGLTSTPLYAEGLRTPDAGSENVQRHKWIGEGYFETLGVPLLAGRPLTWDDAHNLAPVAVVSRRLALAYWGSVEAAIGERVAARPDPPRWHEVVGVVGDVRENGLGQDPVPVVYWPQMTLAHYRESAPTDTMLHGTFSYAIRSDRVGTPGFLDDVKRAVWSVNPSIPLTWIGTMSRFEEISVDQTTFMLNLLGIAALVAVFLGLVGVYGVMSYTVSQRTAELGMRMVLGAEARQVRAMVLRQGLALAAVGVAVGLALSLGLTRVLSSLLFGVSPADPVTFGLVAVGLTAAALAASYVPAARASRVDPMAVLRAE